MVLDVGQAAVVLAGAVLTLPHGLVQRRVAGLVLGVNGHIVVPCCAVDGGHGQGHEERITGAGDIFRDASLYDEVQTLLHIRSGGVSGGIRFGHGHAAVLHGGLQRIFHVRGIGSQRSGQLVVEHIAGEVIDTIVGLVNVCGSQADGRQHGVAAITIVETIQHTHLTLTVQHFIVHGDVGSAKVGELYTLNGILCQLVYNGIVMQPSADVGLGIPCTVFAGCGDVVFIDAQGRFFAGVNGRLGERCGDEAQSHNNGHEQCQYAMDLFHLVVSFISIFLRKQTLAIRASAANRK